MGSVFVASFCASLLSFLNPHIQVPYLILDRSFLGSQVRADPLKSCHFFIESGFLAFASVLNQTVR